MDEATPLYEKASSMGGSTAVPKPVNRKLEDEFAEAEGASEDGPLAKALKGSNGERVRPVASACRNAQDMVPPSEKAPSSKRPGSNAAPKAEATRKSTPEPKVKAAPKPSPESKAKAAPKSRATPAPKAKAKGQPKAAPKKDEPSHTPVSRGETSESLTSPLNRAFTSDAIVSPADLAKLVKGAEEAAAKESGDGGDEKKKKIRSEKEKQVHNRRMRFYRSLDSAILNCHALYVLHCASNLNPVSSSAWVRHG